MADGDCVSLAYTRVRGALSNLGHQVSRSIVAKLLREHGIEPAPERGERTPWRRFVHAHWESVAATDFFAVEVATFGRLVTYYVLIVMELSSRKVHVAGITPGPDSAFMMKTGRNLTDPVDGFLLGKRFLVLDRDKKFTAGFGSGSRMIFFGEQSLRRTVAEFTSHYHKERNHQGLGKTC